MNSIKDQYTDLANYTLSHSDPSFIHQNFVDAYIAQNADVKSKPISLVFALIGLYLHLEKNFTGKQVQQFHQKMVRNKKIWPRIQLPVNRGSVTITDVLSSSPGPERDAQIQKWCESVWESYKENRSAIIDLAEKISH